MGREALEVRDRSTTETYDEYVTRCEDEDLIAFTFEAWDLIREPITRRAMNAAWKTLRATL